MITQLNFYIVIIIILVILLIFTQSSKNSIYDKLISGFYTGDSEFCEESEIDLFCLYIDDDLDINGNCAGYILMKSGDQLLLNEPTMIKLRRQWQWINNKEIYYDIEFVDLEENDFFPKYQTLKFCPISGKIVLFSDDIVYGVFYKSGENSEIKAVMEEKIDESVDDYE